MVIRRSCVPRDSAPPPPRGWRVALAMVVGAPLLLGAVDWRDEAGGGQRLASRASRSGLVPAAWAAASRQSASRPLFLPRAINGPPRRVPRATPSPAPSATPPRRVADADRAAGHLDAAAPADGHSGRLGAGTRRPRGSWYRASASRSSSAGTYCWRPSGVCRDLIGVQTEEEPLQVRAPFVGRLELAPIERNGGAAAVRLRGGALRCPG